MTSNTGIKETHEVILEQVYKTLQAFGEAASKAGDTETTEQTLETVEDVLIPRYEKALNELSASDTAEAIRNALRNIDSQLLPDKSSVDGRKTLEERLWSFAYGPHSQAKNPELGRLRGGLLDVLRDKTKDWEPERLKKKE